MIVTDVNDIIGTEREVHAENGNWVSRRMILAKEGMGFSFHETIIKAGTETKIWYKNHLEAVYCVAGDGEIETIKDGKVYKIYDGIMYALNENDEHLLRGGKEDMRLICVFNPPITGLEVHDSDGAYPAAEQVSSLTGIS
ncbi:MAG: ectoine synthase [Campylobacterales bacterium]